MDVIIRKVGERDGKERFVLISPKSGSAITQQDASEESLRKYFKAKGLSNGFLDECIQKSREQYNKNPTSGSTLAAPPKQEPAKPVSAKPAPVKSASSNPGPNKPELKKPEPKKPEPKHPAAKSPEAKKTDSTPSDANKPDDDDLLFELGLADD